ncbi:hypothetical protein BBJ28_00022196 [Nothophytophthora sp. Chile5]|nr:hypothetical protein BBJ28_00022196 [Nothophytophthora sp. Chile5]
MFAEGELLLSVVLALGGKAAEGDLAALALEEEIGVSTDSLREVKVDNSNRWGAQTQLSLENFPIGGVRERMPMPVIKKCAAKYNLVGFYRPLNDAARDK